MTNQKVPITVAFGDGIGPEIMTATLHILKEGGASLDITEVEIGQKIYLSGEKEGIHPATWEKIRQSKAFLKAPITTPQGGGFKSLNVLIRTTLGLYANVRPCISYAPFVKTKHPDMDVVIIRENEEDLYVGIEYQHSFQSYEALKIMTRAGCERIIRFAFEYALTYQRKKVTCFTKDNILKLTDGLFHKTFEEIGEEYPEIQKEHWIIDIGTAKLADTPDAFDVIVLPNLYGDILSDVAAQIAGSVGLGGSANIGSSGAMFEAIHGSAPRRAGENSANPSGLLLAAIQMLVYIGQTDAATSIHNAWLKTLEEGIHTYDVFNPQISRERVGTKEFAESIVKRLGQLPAQLCPVNYTISKHVSHHTMPSKLISTSKELVGVDLFLCYPHSVQKLVAELNELNLSSIQLKSMSNRGVKVWPNPIEGTLYSDIYRCRFMKLNHQSLSSQDIIDLLQALVKKKLEVVQTHHLFEFNGQAGFTPVPEV